VIESEEKKGKKNTDMDRKKSRKIESVEITCEEDGNRET